MPGWKFVTNHALVLCQIVEQPKITAREIAQAIGITEKTTRSIITDLEAEGYISKKRVGRRLRYRVNADLPLRAETQQDKAVGSLLEVLRLKKQRPRIKTEKSPPQNRRS
ncbi:MAG: winged helix-turn-helix transcriptional regulator [Dehalococcoidia bacterium]|jgi:predicted ArsR family transcriptional regulator|nr:MAG: winged helix-turn-helix transcriptional regulator [Dehalococcoidia bacterium]